ncbi:hypothetical protein S1OALGB6SA_1521 [Olavius algarvensis spirochete endosymbiont]|nr:hypothetical protein S1OALGB6SA_1521 [Olavius algarvensis spirochete endosymbiont]
MRTLCRQDWEYCLRAKSDIGRGVWFSSSDTDSEGWNLAP